jgi:two-component system nitrogen regulation response regulator NtrX
MARILIIDDDESVLTALSGYLGLRGHEALGARTAADGLEMNGRQSPDIVILDVFLGGKNGLDIMERLLSRDPPPGVIVISGHANVPTAVRAVKLGAFDFLEKPVDTDRLDVLISNLCREIGLKHGLDRLRGSWREENLFLGASPAMREAVETAKRAAASALSILIQGESGTGKEVLARLIHMESGRVGGPFVAVNCAAFPPELFESALFGHRKGAFTGAHADREGYFSAAEGGTLFLDEVGDLPLHLQPKLLRALENGEIQRVGSSTFERVDVRIICATNRLLNDVVVEGRFREDLYYRINQLPIRLPSLRERREDINGFAQFFARRRGIEFSKDALEYLRSRDWPGNIRELKNSIERAAVLCESSPVNAGDLRRTDGFGKGAIAGQEVCSTPMRLADAKRGFEKRFVEARLSAHGWSVKETAEELGLLPNNLSRKLAELGISLPQR